MRHEGITQRAKDDIVNAVLYAMKHGCFFPVPRPTARATVTQWIQWGALMNLHRAVADATRHDQAR